MDASGNGRPLVEPLPKCDPIYKRKIVYGLPYPSSDSLFDMQSAIDEHRKFISKLRLKIESIKSCGDAPYMNLNFTDNFDELWSNTERIMPYSAMYLDLESSQLHVIKYVKPGDEDTPATDVYYDPRVWVIGRHVRTENGRYHFMEDVGEGRWSDKYSYMMDQMPKDKEVYEILTGFKEFIITKANEKITELENMIDEKKQEIRQTKQDKKKNLLIIPEPEI